MNIKKKYDEETCDDLFRQAYEEEQKGNMKKAFRLYLKAARLGHPEVQNKVGVCYDVGEGTKKNAKLALYWYKKAWRNGSQTGVCGNIATFYASLGNYRRAVFWWLKEANNDGDTAIDLARYYLTGLWVPPIRYREIPIDPARIKRKGVLKKAVKLLKRVGKSSPANQNSIEEAELLLREIKNL